MRGPTKQTLLLQPPAVRASVISHVTSVWEATRVNLLPLVRGRFAETSAGKRDSEHRSGHAPSIRHWDTESCRPDRCSRSSLRRLRRANLLPSEAVPGSVAVDAAAPSAKSIEQPATAVRPAVSNVWGAIEHCGLRAHNTDTNQPFTSRLLGR